MTIVLNFYGINSKGKPNTCSQFFNISLSCGRSLGVNVRRKTQSWTHAPIIISLNFRYNLVTFHCRREESCSLRHVTSLPQRYPLLVAIALGIWSFSDSVFPVPKSSTILDKVNVYVRNLLVLLTYNCSLAKIGWSIYTIPEPLQIFLMPTLFHLGVTLQTCMASAVQNAPICGCPAYWVSPKAKGTEEWRSKLRILPLYYTRGDYLSFCSHMFGLHWSHCLRMF